eukprot:11372295-Ditylum_brightwellii.AAC.1
MKDERALFHLHCLHQGALKETKGWEVAQSACIQAEEVPCVEGLCEAVSKRHIAKMISLKWQCRVCAMESAALSPSVEDAILIIFRMDKC